MSENDRELEATTIPIEQSPYQLVIRENDDTPVEIQHAQSLETFRFAQLAAKHLALELLKYVVEH